MNQSENTFSLISESPIDTIRIGEILGQLLDKGDVVLLSGDLGAGKTCLTQGIVKGLDSKDIARSPTFVIVAEYAGRFPIYHMDLYRLDQMQGVDDLYLDEYLYGDGVCLIEWPPKDDSILPVRSLLIEIDKVDEETRGFKFISRHESLTELLRNFERNWIKET
ncbi:MAG: tRNA (adenosine(37)-N6)-threonylcarbamoyltransferase complex ATPase subunit type 1 TsaE [Dehalococcoidia bacterium]